MVCVVLLGVTQGAGAQVPEEELERLERMSGGVVERPKHAQRLVRLWDFEDRAGHREAIPAEWFRDQHIAERFPFGVSRSEGRERVGFPPWNRAEYSNRHAATGDWSIALPTRGGSTALTLSRNALTVFAGSDYLVTALVRTEWIEHGRARLVVRMLDSNRELIPDGEVFGEPVLSDGAWSRVSVYIDATPAAAWMQIELQLLQPAQWRGEGLSEEAIELLPQDFEGSAFFDDLAVYQLPRVELEVVGEWSIARSALPPEVTVALRDQAGEPLHARLRVLGLDGVLVDETRLETPLDLTPIPWRPRLPEYGWYRVEASIHNDRGVVGFAEASFGWLPEEREMAMQSRAPFGVMLGQPVPAVLESAAAMIRASGAGSAMISPWPAIDAGESASHAAALADSAGFQRAIEELSAMGLELTLVLESIPEGIAAQAGVDRRAVLHLLADTPPDGWMPALTPLLAAFGERIRRWQIGGVGDPTALSRPDLSDAVRSVYQILRRLIPRPIVIVPGRAEDDPSMSAEASRSMSNHALLSLQIPHEVPEASIASLIEPWSAMAPPMVVIEPLPHEHFGQRVSVLALARRAILAHEAGAARIMVRQPWHVRGRERRGDLVLPMPDLVAWSRLVDELVDRTPSVRLPMPDGVMAILFEGQRGAMLVAWNLGADPTDAIIEGYLGDGPIIVRDLWGNTTEEYSAGEAVRIQTDEMPRFIHGIDPRILRFRAGIDFGPRRLPSRGALIASEITLTNPFPGQITGRIRLAEPEGWEMRPQIVEFAIDEGETVTRPVELRFGVGERSGQRELVLEVEAIADRRYPLIHAPIPVEVGLPNLHVLPMYRIEPGEGGRRDLVIELMITNLGELPVSSSITALVPGFASERAPLSNLLPGQIAIRRFGFPGGGDTLPGQSGMVIIRDNDGSDRLTIEVPFQ